MQAALQTQRGSAFVMQDALQGWGARSTNGPFWALRVPGGAPYRAKNQKSTRCYEMGVIKRSRSG